MEVFDVLNALNVNDRTEKKKTGSAELTYLSWSWAWAEVKKHYPDVSYTIWKAPDTHLPYVFDPETGYMVFTSVTIENVTHDMWLPVMDGGNHAMRDKPYNIKTKYKEVTVPPATMMDINKTIMRCLVKNLAMFGLGLYIYAGEDLPEGEEPEQAPGEESEQAPEETPILCEACGKPIEGRALPDGKTISRRTILKRGKDQFSMKYCYDCLEKEVNRQKAQQQLFADLAAHPDGN